MLDKIESIRQALESKCYQPALALALTLPDICGQIENPNTGSGQRYRDWFDKWVNHRYADNTGWHEEENRALNPFFFGKMCWKLRCAFLHSGNSEIGNYGEREDEHNRYSYNFELILSDGVNSFGEMWIHPQKDVDKLSKTKTVKIDVIELCKNICLSAEEYYSYKGKKAFEEHSIKIVDIQSIFK